MFSSQSLRPWLLASLDIHARDVPNQAQLQGAAKRLSEHGLIAITWAGFVAAVVFVVLRCFARLSDNHRLFTDDYWVIAALTILLINAILQTIQAPSLYYLVFAGAGRVPAGEALIKEGTHYVYFEFVIIGLFWTVLWCVKASFLALFYRLFEGLPRYRLVWWAVVVFSTVAYIGCWIASVWTCHPPSTYFKFGQCEKPIDAQGSNISISYSTAVDILSDLFIMMLPLRLLPNLQVSRRQKIGLAGVFCVGVLVIASAIARLTQIIGQERSDPVGLAVWGVVESSVSVIVGSLPPLKSFFEKTISKTRRGYSPYGDDHGLSKATPRSKTPAEESKGGAIPLVTSGNTGPRRHSHTSSRGQITVQQDFGWVRTSDSEAEASGPYDDEARIFHPVYASPQSRQVDGRTWLNG